MRAFMHKLHNSDLGLLVIRLGLGGAFLAHGIQKLQGMDGIVAFFGSLGFPPFLAWLVAIVETVGGLAILLGVGVELAGALLAVIMIVAILKVRLSAGFLGGYELEMMLLAMSLAMIFAGSGKYGVRMPSRGKKASGDAQPLKAPGSPAQQQ